MSRRVAKPARGSVRRGGILIIFGNLGNPDPAEFAAGPTLEQGAAGPSRPRFPAPTDSTRSPGTAMSTLAPTPTSAHTRHSQATPPPQGAPAPAPGPAPRRPGGWPGRVRRALWARLPGWLGGTRRLHEFVDLVAAARDPGRIEEALVALAGAVAGAPRVELTLDRDDASAGAGTGTDAPADARPVALWPAAAAAMTAAEVEALGYPLCLGLWCGDHYRMTLQVYARPGRGCRWPARVVLRLTTLCGVAAAGLRGLHAGRRARPEAPVEMTASVRDATFLCAILPYALAQAQRHGEPLTVFCLDVDRRGPLAQAHGADAVDRAVRRVAEAVAATLRGNDVVARLDDDRVVAVLPNTGPADALTVAALVRKSIAGACLPVGTMPALSVSLGVACFPADARETVSLLAAADEAMTLARSAGPDQTLRRPPPGSR